MERTRLILKNSKGITLIALIITIIILLILAIVTIGSIKDSNIITYAQNASSDYNNKKDKEESVISGYEALIKEEVLGVGKAEVDQIVDKNSTINGEMYSSANPIIPAGFKAINTEFASWEKTNGPEVSRGLVISDNNSEFVWVPVYEINDMVMCQECGATEEGLKKDTLQCNKCGERKLAGKLYAKDVGNSFNSETTEQTYKTLYSREPDVVEIYDKDYTEYLTKEQLQREFDDMAKSVAKYGGFYVGRYETSLTLIGIAQSKKGETSSNASEENTKSWYGLYEKSKTYVSAKKSVRSTMIWGSQYDAMMRWIADEDDNKVESNI